MSNFGRVVEVLVAGMTFSMEHFNMEGEVPFDDDVLPNESVIRIWNLSAETINKIKRGETLMVNAGYSGDVGVILHSFVSAVRTTWEGVNKITSIYVMDSEDLSKRTLKDVSYKAGTLGSYIIKAMAGQIGLPIAQFELVQDYRYTDGYTASGEVTEIIAKVAKDCKTSVFINKSKLYVRNLRRGADDLFKLSDTTGLIGTPEYQEGEESKGYQLKSQLQYRITTASVIDLVSRTFKGRLYVRGGSHSFSRTGDFVTTMEAVL
jgi:hypothetical protein